MMTRTVELRDIEMLAEIHARAQLRFPLPDFNSPLLEAKEIVVNDKDEIVAGALAYRTIELYLFCPPGPHPLVKMDAIQALHSPMRDKLAAEGYKEAFAFIQPEFQAFGRHLQKWFGWERTWPAYRIADWKGEVGA